MKTIAVILGSAFILISTSLIGILSLNYESKINVAKNKYMDIENKLISSERSSQYANLEFNISHIQKSIADNSIYQFKDYQKRSFEAWVASLSVILLNQYGAAGYSFSEYKDSVVSLRDKAINGDEAAYNKMIELTQKLSVESGQFRGDLVMKKLEAQNTVSQLENIKRKIQFLAIVFQILGLFLLIFKEVPIKKQKV